MTREVEARRAYELWLSLVQDEPLYDATLEGRHAELAASRALALADLQILDEFRAQPGLRWNVENLRFRAAVHVAGNLLLHLQRTIYLLTRGDADWIQELVFEYLAHHHWRELGHEHLNEAERFAAYVQRRVLKRRIPPNHIDDVLAFELALVRHLRAVSRLAPAEWPAARGVSAEQLASARPRRSPTAMVVELAVDLTDWIKSADPRQGEVRDGAIAVLVTVPSPGAPYRFQRLSTEIAALYRRCDGAATGAEIVAGLGEDYDPDDVYLLLAQWVERGALAV